MRAHVRKQRDSAAHYTAGEMGSMTRGKSVAGAPGRCLNADIVFRLQSKSSRGTMGFSSRFSAQLAFTGRDVVLLSTSTNVCLEVGRHRFHIPWGPVHGGWLCWWLFNGPTGRPEGWVYSPDGNLNSKMNQRPHSEATV